MCKTNMEGQGQPNLRAFTPHREEWELSNKVFHQSKIRQAISTFKLFKLPGSDKLCLYSCNRVVKYLMTHLCHILAGGYNPQPAGRSKWHLYPNPVRSTTPRLRHIFLLVSQPSCWKQWKNWWRGILGMRFWGCIPYNVTSLPKNQGSPLKLHWNM